MKFETTIDFLGEANKRFNEYKFLQLVEQVTTYESYEKALTALKSDPQFVVIHESRKDEWPWTMPPIQYFEIINPKIGILVCAGFVEKSSINKNLGAIFKW